MQGDSLKSHDGPSYGRSGQFIEISMLYDSYGRDITLFEYL